MKFIIKNKIIISSNHIQKREISLNNALKDTEIETLFLRYIAERIAVVLRNREDNYIVYEEYGKNVYQATSPEIDDKFGIIHIHMGFRYKPILLKSGGNIGIIIEPKSKFFSENTLRDLWEDNKIKYDNNRNTEKICCVVNCPDYLNPFGTCDLNYPSYFSNIKDLKIVNEKPSKATINLLEFYKDENICPTKLLSEKIIDKEPLIHRIFWSNPEKVYSYPLEILRIVPITSDAGSDAKSLMRKIQPKPFERFKRIKEEYMNLITDLRDLNFPIIPEELLDTRSSDIVKVDFANPTYLLKNEYPTEFPSIEYNDIGFYKQSCNGKDTLHFHLLYFKSGKGLDIIENLLKSSESLYNNIETYKSFSKIENIQLTPLKIKKLDDVQKILNAEQPKVYHFYILINDIENIELHNNVKSLLIENDKPNQTININTLNDIGYGSLRSLIYLQIYLKSEGKTWVLEEVFRSNEIIIGLNIKFFKDHVIASILVFTNQGDFIEGKYLNENPEIFDKKLLEILSEEFKKYTSIFLLIFGPVIPNIVKSIENITDSKNLDIVGIKYASLVRLFEQDDKKKWMIYPPKQGNGVIINGKSCHIITSKTQIGTPSCIKVRVLSTKSDNLRNILSRIFKLSRYNPALVKNETKLPFPLHFARSTLQKGIQYNLNSFSFKIPFYL